MLRTQPVTTIRMEAMSTAVTGFMAGRSNTISTTIIINMAAAMGAL